MGLFELLRQKSCPRVAFIGIDGVPYSLIMDNPEVFKNLNFIAANGSGGAMESIVPPESSACWPSITTGKNPGATGVYGFQEREIGSYETYISMGNDVHAKRVWELVKIAGREATVVNVPVTYPPQKDIQRMASGFLSPSVRKAAAPQEFREYLESIGYRIDVNSGLGHKDDKDDFLDDAFLTLEKRFEAFKYCIEKNDWDLFFGVFMTTDRVNHFLYGDYELKGKYLDEFLEFYKKLDEYIGILNQMIPEDVIKIIASDHGFTTLKYQFYANEWLRRQGWLEYKNKGGSGLENVSCESKAYSMIPGRFYINLENREWDGKVEGKDYEAVRKELKDMLLKIKSPDGESVMRHIWNSEEVFRGDNTENAPDLVAVPNNGFDLKSSFDQKENIYDVGPRSGMHTFENASLIISKPGLDIEGSNLYDIAPTILSMMEIKYEPECFDGKSLI
jgi:predicted AlkP superfamily phosphohydrolase/phosphomutase